MIFLDINELLAKEHKLRVVEEYVPGKQITLAHIIANPDSSLFDSLQVSQNGNTTAIGIVTVTPGEAAIILGDIAIKASGVRLLTVDRTDGSLLFTGTVSQTEASLRALMDYAEQTLQFTGCNITRN